MKKSRITRIVFLAVSVLVLSSCVSKKKKKCDTCPSWGGIEVEK